MEEIIFDIGEAGVGSSPVKVSEAAHAAPDLDVPVNAAPEEADLSPAQKLLARPELPKLVREDRARLLMQSPTRLYFYWSLGSDPYQSLQGAFANGAGSYTLVLRLVESHSDSEEVHRAESEGNWWFEVNPGSEYRAEIGFYAPNRPFIRLMFSNTVATPRKGPSPRPASEAHWSVSTHKFAEVLDVSGFVEDAFEVAAEAFDDVEFYTARLASITGRQPDELRDVPAGEIRLAIASLAAGEAFESLKWRIGAGLFAVLQADREKLLAAGRGELAYRFGIEPDEAVEFEDAGTAIFGASALAFPRRRRGGPRYAPVSSAHLG